MPTENERSALQKTPKTARTIEVIMDSNALFVPMQFKIDIIAELERLLDRRFELILLSPVRHELEMLASEKAPKTAKMATFALKFSEKCRLVEAHTSAKTVDDAIVETATECRSLVFTNDARLRKRLRNISVPVIYVRQKSHLAIEGMIQSHV